MRSLVAMTRLHLVVVCLLGLTLSGSAGAEDLRLPAIDGKSYAALEAEGKKAVLLFFVSPFCSTTRPFMEEINAIAAEYADRAAVSLVHSDSEITVEVAFEHAELSGVKTRVLVDREQRLARRVGATVTPEAVILSPAGDVLYRGRINDLYLGPTKRQRRATTHDLRDALDLVLAGKALPQPPLAAQGCKIGGLRAP